MSVWVICGELGQGKTLMAVSKIQEALWQGRRVATNIDLRLEKLVGTSHPRDVTRLPDFPRVDDFMALGYGHGEGRKGRYDESKFGLIVLDELAGYMNSRTWSKDGSRDKTITWMRHARKFRWHIILITQDIESIDKQIRTALCEHVVRCFRTDNVRIPLVGGLVTAFGLRGALPRTHIGIVRRGTEKNGLLLDRWVLTPPFAELQAAYDTQQKIIGPSDVVLANGEKCSYTAHGCDGASTVLDHRHAPYLWAPGGWRERLWELLAWRWLPESPARVAYNDSRLFEAGLMTPYKPHLTFAEWEKLQELGEPSADATQSQGA